ncbi:MAG: hypothetical protein GQF41_1939 [Candidatus Rifleibacterium amylolyticum]|nr:MAG: hypothetical protein GQF41_1939 [Candidatus Rifleibacterium amylolyticum]
MARRKHNPKQSQTDIKDSWGEQKTTDSFAGKTVRRQSGAVSQTASEGLSSANAEKLLTSVQNDEKAARSSFARWFEDLPEYRVAFAKEEETLSSLNFSLQKKLGEGGMGVVYSGVQKSIGREIAIKFLKKEFLTEKDAAQRFILEGQITGRLDHPNILPIFDLGRSQNGDLFIAMQKISGKRWDQVFSQKRPKENLEIFLRACDAIAYAHSRGVIHRDLKPENVMLGEFGEIIITDWGLALSLKQEEGSCVEQTQAGTPAYMAPEVACCDLASVDERTDIYLLGATLFEVWTGKAPHTGKDVYACLEAAARNIIQPVDKADEIVEIARKAMATNPADRYSSVIELQKAVQEYLLHSESLGLTRSARVEFEKPGNSYSDLSRALALFEEALKLWSENLEARKGVLQTRLRFAAAALARRDLNLGESLLLPDCPEHQEVLARIRQAQAERKNRIRRLQVVSFVFMGFAIAVFFIILNIKSRLETERDLAMTSFKALNLEKTSLLAGHDAVMNELTALKAEKDQLLRPFFQPLQPR